MILCDFWSQFIWSLKLLFWSLGTITLEMFTLDTISLHVSSLITLKWLCYEKLKQSGATWRCEVDREMQRDTEASEVKCEEAITEVDLPVPAILTNASNDRDKLAGKVALNSWPTQSREPRRISAQNQYIWRSLLCVPDNYTAHSHSL